MVQRIHILCLTLLISSLFMFDSANAATIALPVTGQTTCYNASGTAIACVGTGQDGETQRGIAAPTPRFTDNGNGTVSDRLTGLIWLKNADCTDTVGSIIKSSGYLTWGEALIWSNGLASGACGLSDGSIAGQWRLPDRNELDSLVDRSRSNPALPAGHPFTSVQSDGYGCWSSSSIANSSAWVVSVGYGVVDYVSKYNYSYVWPVRSGQ